MNRTQATSVGSKPLATLAVVAAVMIVAFVIAGEFNLSFAWSLIATALPLLVLIAFERFRETGREWRLWTDATPMATDIRAEIRYNAVIAVIGLSGSLVGSALFYSRNNPWWISVCLALSIICLMLGPVEDEPQGE